MRFSMARHSFCNTEYEKVAIAVYSQEETFIKARGFVARNKQKIAESKKQECEYEGVEKANRDHWGSRAVRLKSKSKVENRRFASNAENRQCVRKHFGSAVWQIWPWFDHLFFVEVTAITWLQDHLRRFPAFSATGACRFSCPRVFKMAARRAIGSDGRASTTADMACERRGTAKDRHALTAHGNAFFGWVAETLKASARPSEPVWCQGSSIKYLVRCKNVD